MRSLLESVQLGSLVLANRGVHGTTYAKPRRRRWRAQRARCDLLRATGVSRTNHH